MGYKTIKIMAYEADGKPTCAEDFSEDKFCQFITTRKLGTVNVCAALGKDLDYQGDPLGFSKPLAGCPIWAEPSPIEQTKETK